MYIHIHKYIHIYICLGLGLIRTARTELGADAEVHCAFLAICSGTLRVALVANRPQSSLPAARTTTYVYNMHICICIYKYKYK